MIALIIIIAVIMLIVLTLNIPVTAYIRYHDGEADIKIRFLSKQLYPRIEKKKRQKRKRKKRRNNIKKPENKPLSEEISFETSEPVEDEPKASAEESDSSEGKKGSEKAAEEPPKKEKQGAGLLERLNAKLDELSEKKSAVQTAFELVKEPLKKLGGKVRIDDLMIDFAAADEDAYEAAMLYGKVNAAVYNALSVVRCFVPVSVTGIKIDCLFNTPADKCRWDGECKVRLRPASLLNAIIAVVFGYAKDKEKYAPAAALFK